MKRLVVVLVLVGASAAWLAYGTVNAVKVAQHKQVSALSVADQIN
jgi:hypothetical protein